jgi:hypothetical protein
MLYVLLHFRKQVRSLVDLLAEQHPPGFGIPVESLVKFFVVFMYIII